MDHDAERATKRFGERQDRDAVADAEGVVGHDDQWLAGRRHRAGAHAANLQFDEVEHCGRRHDRRRGKPGFATGRRAPAKRSRPASASTRRMKARLAGLWLSLA